MRLYVGSQAWTVQGERDDLAGERCWTAAHKCQAAPADPYAVRCLLDSGDFSDPPQRRLDPAGALERQIAWEADARERLAAPAWTVEAVVSYDRLIDETWQGGKRYKRRWTLSAAESAVRQTVEAAAYLASRRRELSPRFLVMACQGVECGQYRECAVEVLRHAQPGDWLGLGGWCLLGRAKTLLPEFWRTCRAVLPLAAAAGLRRVHLFGCTHLPALGGLLWLADRLEISISCDSARPILDCCRGNSQKAGRRHDHWRDNVAWWRTRLAGLRESPCYRQPPRELW